MSQAAAGIVSIRLPRALLEYWSGPATVELSSRTLAEAFAGLEERAPGLRGRIVDDQGRIRRHVAVFINRELVEHRHPAAISLRPGDTVQIVPSVSGG